jgi:hypothetical protein
VAEPKAADYIAAAIAYAIDIRRVQPTSQCAPFFGNLLKDEFGANVPERAVLQALQVLNNEAVLISDGDRFVPTVRIPADLHERVVRWRFSDQPTAAAQIHDRFSNGSWDWMANVLASSEFSREIEAENGAPVVLTEQFKTWETLGAGIANRSAFEVGPKPEAVPPVPTGPIQLQSANIAKTARSIDWGKWGAIASIAALPVAFIIWWLS